jgi:hypothetical protein
LALPTKVLGTEYISINYNSLKNSQIGVTAINNDTNITINSKIKLNGPDGVVLANEPYSINVQKGEVIMFTSTGDLTGSSIISDKPIAVTSGNECTNVPTNSSACDHLSEMLPSIDSLGDEFYIQPLSGRSADLLRIVAATDNTEISFNDNIVATINKGEHFDKLQSESVKITTSNPAMVAQYSLGTSYDNVKSDPFMMLITPTKQYLSRYTFSTLSSGENFDKNYVNIVIATSYLNSLKIDGHDINKTQFSNIGTSDYSGGSILLNENKTHNITADVPFATFIYGFGEYDSYGYPGGMYLSK